MPLHYDASQEAFQHNLKAELRSGKSREQALAIAYSVQRQSGKGTKMAKKKRASKKVSKKSKKAPKKSKKKSSKKKASKKRTRKAPAWSASKLRAYKAAKRKLINEFSK